MKFILKLLLLLPMVLLASKGLVQKSWRVANSPYVVNGDIEIPSNTLLMIEPGVEVIFSGDFVFKVDGYLQAKGTYDDKIVFKGVDGQPWKGIRFDFERAEDDTIVSILNNCHISNSYAPTTGLGQSGGYGGAVHIDKGNKVLISDCTIEDNDAENDGGAVSLFNGSLTIRNCIIRNNSANNGGAIYSLNSLPTLINNTIVDNVAREFGGAVYASNSSGYFVNNIFWGNRAVEGDQFYLSDLDSDPNFYNCNVEGSDKEFAGIGSGENFTGKYLDCINEDPLIEDSVKDIYYTLDENSPCINQGAKEYELITLPNFDIIGNDRVNEVVDIGSVEYYPESKIDEADKNHSLITNYPNPFNGYTTINFSLDYDKRAGVVIYNNSGKVIKEFMKDFNKGENSFTLNFNGLATGIYYISIKSEDVVAIKKLHYIK